MVDRIADYLLTIEARSVLPPVEPGSIGPLFPAHPPERPEPLADILADVDRLVVPNATHWQHPGFLAYFATTASGPGMLGEFLTAGLGQNPMLWRTSPIGTELETVVVGWLREALGLPATFGGLLTDTASTSTLIALAGAREASGLDAAAGGLAARAKHGEPRLYASAEAHSSIEKAAMTLGLGRAAVAKIPIDGDFRDGRRGPRDGDRDRSRRGPPPGGRRRHDRHHSSTSVDPVAAIADVAAREGLWLHVDAAYAGPVALLPERRSAFAGWERADSIVVNPHKWLFTPLDASLLLTRRLDQLRAAFSLVPEYLRTLDRASPSSTTTSSSRSWAGGCGRSSCGCCCAGSGSRGSAADRLPPGARPALRGAGRRRSRLGAAGAGPVLDGVLPLPPGEADGSRRRGRRPRPAR